MLLDILKVVLGNLSSISSLIGAPKKDEPQEPAENEPAADVAPATFKGSVTVEKVKKMFPATKVENIKEHLPLILDALEAKGLCDKDLVCYSLATILVENDKFTPLTEKPSQWSTKSKKKPYDFSAYEGRSDLGNRAGTDDHKKFVGRGLIQITGRANYETMDRKLKLDGEMVSNPEYANIPQIAAAIFAQYMKDREVRIRKTIGKRDFAEMRKIVNGGTIHLAEFEAGYKLAETLF